MIDFRCEIFSEDGADHIADAARFAVGDLDAPAALARAMLGRAPPSIRSLVRAANEARCSCCVPNRAIGRPSSGRAQWGSSALSCPLFAVEPVEWSVPDPAAPTSSCSPAPTRFATAGRRLPR